MGAQPVAAELFRETGCQAFHRQPAGVGADDGPWLAESRDALQEISLDLQIFRHRLDNPAGLSYPGKVVLKISGSNP